MIDAIIAATPINEYYTYQFPKVKYYDTSY